MLLLIVLLLNSLHLVTSQSVYINRTGCGTVKACLFKPNGCDPNQDCTTALVMGVINKNELFIQMVATALIPHVQQQYIAVAFSEDTVMGNDQVTECVLSDMGDLYGYEPEIFLSRNKGKSNDRLYLSPDDHSVIFKNIASEVVDGRIMCQFVQQLSPEIDRKSGLIWSLDKPYYVMLATGSAQPDEVNAHDMNQGSHFYPITSQMMINPSTLTNQTSEALPPVAAAPPVQAAPPAQDIQQIMSNTITQPSRAMARTQNATVSMSDSTINRLSIALFTFLLTVL